MEIMAIMALTIMEDTITLTTIPIMIRLTTMTIIHTMTHHIAKSTTTLIATHTTIHPTIMMPIRTIILESSERNRFCSFIL